MTATPGGASDAKISRGDTISVSFDEATNMPPFNTTSYTLNTSEVDMVFDFALPFINTTLVTDAYSGIWLSPIKFLLTINDEGYPQPFSSVSKIETAVGVWTVSVDQSRGPCSRISNQYIDPYCLLTADATSLQANSTSPVLVGSFGKTLPNVTVIVVQNDLVESEVLQVSFSSRVHVSCYSCNQLCLTSNYTSYAMINQLNRYLHLGMAYSWILKAVPTT